ncbi:MAG TPA: carboxymuconolactone decarboxylase family protein [Dehalococcoidia bacterium]|nr:carboxymuconolactone decarboxylase family protein [Dehalococcoidia bacterium]
MSTDAERIERGRQTMMKLLGPRAGERSGIMYEMNPEFADLVIGVLFGEIWSDETIPLKTRSFCTMTALIVLNRQEELRIHIRGALNVGITKQEILALIAHMAFYGGMPVAVESLRTAKAVFERWDAAQAKK